MTTPKTLFLAGAIALAAGGASGETYRMANYNPESEITVINQRWLAEEVAKATNGEVQFEVFGGGVLMPAKAQLQGVGDGVAQAGFHSVGYTPSELPLSNALSGFGFIAPDPTVLGAAFADWVMHDTPGYHEYRGHNVVPLGGFSTPLYPFICNTSEPVTTLDQIKGLKVRMPGGANATLLQHLGGIPVNIPAPEIYQALQTGQIDCAAILAGWLNIDSTLEEVSKSTTVMNWTGSFQSPQQIYNADFWNGLTPDQRRAIMELTARGHARMQITFNTNNEKALTDAQAHGHLVVEPDESVKAAVADWVANGVGDMAGVAKTTFGVADPEALFATFEPYLTKWTDLIAGMKDPNDEDELTQLFLDNMYNDLDPATYGKE